MTAWDERSTRRLLCVLVGFIWCIVGCTFLLADSQCSQSPRDAMRAWVVEIAATTKSHNPQFLVIAQNGDELLTTGDSASSPLANDYGAAIDGLGREDLFYGYSNDNEPTPSDATDWMLSYLDRAETMGIQVLSIDYCWDPVRMDDSTARNLLQGFVSFAAPDRMLDVIPDYPASPINENADNVLTLADVGNFLTLINPWQFASKQSFLYALIHTNYDALIVDLAFEGDLLVAEDVAALKVKANGGRRLVLCYVSIGEAEDYRAYWTSDWITNPPSWLLAENPDWPGNYSVQFWHPEWKATIFAMLDAVLAAGFDGVYLDRVDAYEEFENE